MTSEQSNKPSEKQEPDSKWNQARVISAPGSALEVRAVAMPESVRTATGKALSDGKAQRSFFKSVSETRLDHFSPVS